MLIKKVSKMIILMSIILMFSFLFASCGDDENPVKPPVVILPEGLSAVDGDFYKAVMGSTIDIEFIAVDTGQEPVENSWVHFSTFVGDGSFVNDSVRTDTAGIAVCQYIFDGNLGHAELQVLIRDIDTISVIVRANTLIPGATGQGQYILMEDTYSDIIIYNGTPECVDPDPNSWHLYVVYESNLGVVFMIEDVNEDSVAVDTAQVVGVTVNTVYAGKTSDSIGIGSTLGEITTAYGVIPDSLSVLEGAGFIVNCGTMIPVDADWRYKLPDQGLTIYTDINLIYEDRQIFEMHLNENVTQAQSSVKLKDGSSDAMSEIVSKRYSK